MRAAGSWEAGVDGARAGIVMPAHPRVGDTYRQEFYLGEAEDEARVLGTRRLGDRAIWLLRPRVANTRLHAARPEGG